MLLLGAKGAPEGPGPDFSSILASVLVSLGACGGLWASFGKLLAAFGHPNGGPGRPKRAQKTSKSGFVDTSKTIVLLRTNMVFGSLGAPRSSKSYPEDLIWEVFGDLGEHFGGLGGSWEQVGILMDFRSIPGTPGNPGTWEVEATNMVWWP